MINSISYATMNPTWTSKFSGTCRLEKLGSFVVIAHPVLGKLPGFSKILPGCKHLPVVPEDRKSQDQ